MAEKKVFTSLSMQALAVLKQPRLDPLSSLPSSGLEAGQASVVGGKLHITDGTSWYEQLTAENNASITALWDFHPASAGVPFTLHTNAQGQKVVGLNADLLDGATADNAAGGNLTIPVRDAGNQFHVGTPTADTHVSNKGYVDTAVQGLDHKEGVKFTTTDNITLSGLTNQSDKIDGTPIAGDRILVKDQTVAGDNGIYIAASGAWTRATDADFGSELVVNGTFTSNLDGWTPSSGGAGSVEQSGGKAVLTDVADHLTTLTTTSAITVEVGKRYKFSFQPGGYVGNYQRYYIGTTSGAGDIYSSGYSSTWAANTPALQEAYFTATTASVFISFHNANDTGAWTVDDVSIREADLNEGAFVFVEDGSTKINTSWVLTAGSGLSAWTQFSGAGQLDVTSNGAVAAPLTKSGDTVNLAYNAAHFDIGNDAGSGTATTGIQLKNSGITGDRLANDAVGASKLDDSASFQMARLGLGVAAHASYGLIVKNDAAPGSHIRLLNGSELGFINLRDDGDLDIWAHGSNKIQFKTGAGSGVNRAFITETGVGIGADASSPSGTLHVSTARYGA